MILALYAYAAKNQVMTERSDVMARQEKHGISVLNMTIPAVVSWTILFCCVVGGLFTIYRRDVLLCILFIVIAFTFGLLLKNIHTLEVTHKQLHKAIAKEKSKLVEVAESAKRDPLTHLYNKTETEELVEDYIAGCDDPAAFIFIDVDNFKAVNDTMGHLFGDAVLSELALKLRTLFRDSDIVGRIGGDEFVIFMTRINDTEVIENKIRNVMQAFSRSFSQKETKCHISASVGAALYPRDGRTFEDLMGKSDMAMYHAKNHGKNGYQFYSNIEAENGGDPVIVTLRPTVETPETPQKNFRENVADYMLKIFFEYNDVNRSVPVLLDFVGRAYGIGRIEVASFSDDDKYFYCLHEWCQEGVEPLDTGTATPSDPWEVISPKLDEDNILYCEDLRASDTSYLDNDSARKRGVRTIIICYILENGRRRAAVSFEYFDAVRPLTAEMRDSLLTISRTVCLFVVRK